MKDLQNLTAAELTALGERVERQRRERRLAERVERELPGRAQFPRLDGEREWLEIMKKSCGNATCRKGCKEGKPSHGPYWYLYRPAPERKAGVTSHHLGRELPADVAASFGLPEKLEAENAHRYTRQVREAEILQDEANAMASEVEASEVEASEAEASEARLASATQAGREKDAEAEAAT